MLANVGLGLDSKKLKYMKDLELILALIPIYKSKSMTGLSVYKLSKLFNLLLFKEPSLIVF